MEPGTKLAMMRTRIDDGDEGAVDRNKIWVRARLTVVDLGLDAAPGQERCEPGRRRRWREMGEARGGG